jgi:hypothetical protein
MDESKVSGDKTVWVVNAEGSGLPCGIFTTEERAREFVGRYGFPCTLSEFPLDESAFEHAIARGFFSPRSDGERSPWFVSQFTPRLQHFHLNEPYMS